MRFRSRQICRREPLFEAEVDRSEQLASLRALTLGLQEAS